MRRPPRAAEEGRALELRLARPAYEGLAAICPHPSSRWKLVSNQRRPAREAALDDAQKIDERIRELDEAQGIESPFE